MIPTKRGIVMLAVAVVLYALAWQTQIGWFYVADAIVVAIFIVNMPLPWLAMRGLSAHRTVETRGAESSELFEDDTVGLAIELRNSSWLPKSLVTLRERCLLAAPDEEDKGFLMAGLAPRGRMSADYESVCYRRGVFTFEPILVETSAPFGLFRAQRTLDAPLEVTVYPKVLPMGTTFNPGYLQGNMPDNSPPVTSGEFRGSREFQRGDRVRNIHWRNSARSGRLMVKEFDKTPQGEIRLAFNLGFESGEGRDTTLEYAVKIAASVARRSFLDGRPFRMWPSGPEGSLATWHGVLEHLAQLEGSPDDSIPQLLSHRGLPGVSVMVVWAEDRDTLASVQHQLSLAGHMVAVLLEGFGPREDEAATDAAEALGRMGMTVVHCRLGELGDALESLGRTMVTPEPAGRRIWA